MKTLSFIKWLFTLIGLGALIGLWFLSQSTLAFLDIAQPAEGEVIEFQESRSDDSTVYRPVVKFKDASGREVIFTSSVGSNPPGYDIGERVKVLYLADNSKEAQIDSFFEIWFGATILAVLGSIFFLVGAALIISPIYSKRAQDRLRLHGKAIQADFKSVTLDTSVTINGQHPYRVVAHWHNTLTNEIHIFESSPLWFDPTDYIKRDNIQVYVDPANPKRYYVDTSFLPKLAQ